jgi:hypothetical protein
MANKYRAVVELLNVAAKSLSEAYDKAEVADNLQGGPDSTDLMDWISRAQSYVDYALGQVGEAPYHPDDLSEIIARTEQRRLDYLGEEIDRQRGSG